MLNKKVLALCMATTLSSSLLVACGSSASSTVSSESDVSASTTETALTGEITFSLNRSEEELSTLYQPIADRFMQENPGTSIQFVVHETDAQIARTQLNAGEFADISIAPRDITPSDLSRFYLPLGSTEELSQTYQYAGLLANDGITYGLPNGVTHSGMLYNKTVVDTYLNGEVPSTLDAWYAACETLKENGITPVWINAGSRWPMSEWDNIAFEISGDPGYRNSLQNVAEPWAEGTPLSQEAQIFQTLIENDWIEEDTVLDQWDASRKGMASGEIGFMILGSWAVPQLRDVAETLGLDPDTIGFAPVPYKNDVSADSPLNVLLSEDMLFAINKDTQYPELAKAFLEYFLASEAPSLMGLSSPIIGGEKAEWVTDLASLDYVNEMEKDLPDAALTEKCNEMQLDVFMGGTYLITHVLEPLKNGQEPTLNALNSLWSENFG